MNYTSVSDFAKKYKMPERTIKNYYAQGKFKGYLHAKQK